MNQHLSEDQFCRAVAGQSTADEQRHVDTCPACRTELGRFMAALAAFRSGVTVLADREAPRFALTVESRTAALSWRQTSTAVAVVATIALLAWIPESRRSPAPAAGRGSVPAVEEASEFFPLVYSTVPVTDGRIVRLEVPAAVLPAFGLEADSAQSRRGAVLADVVVGEDGLARAVRFVRPLRGHQGEKEKQP